MISPELLQDSWDRVRNAVHLSVLRLGGYWPWQRIVFRLGEENGEVCDAAVHEDKEQMMAEAGDLIYTAVALITALGGQVSTVMRDAIARADAKKTD